MVGVRSPRGTRWDTARIPDVTVLPIAQLKELETRECVIDTFPSLTLTATQILMT